MTTIRAFFFKLGHFFPIFEKGQESPEKWKYLNIKKLKVTFMIRTKILHKYEFYGLVLQKVCRIIKLSQKTWLKPCLAWIQNEKQKQNMTLKKKYLRWWMIQLLQRTPIEIKLMTAEKGRSLLVSEPIYLISKWLSESFFGNSNE